MITFSTTNQTAARVRADLLVVPFFAEREAGPGADVVDAALGGALDAFLEDAGYSGKVGETLTVPLSARSSAKAAVLVGLGPRTEITPAVLRRAGAALARRASKATAVATTLAAAAGDLGP
ncbi:MAG: M17 family peptidase N-terminal domain-containing protein [Acidimicrobiia bacterium]